MTDPFAQFPRDEDGRLHGGPFHWIADDALPEAIEDGWRPLPPTDGYAHPVTSGRGTLCYWAGEGPMRLPEAE